MATNGFEAVPVQGEKCESDVKVK